MKEVVPGGHVTEVLSHSVIRTEMIKNHLTNQDADTIGDGMLLLSSVT